MKRKYIWVHEETAYLDLRHAKADIGGVWSVYCTQEYGRGKSEVTGWRNDRGEILAGYLVKRVKREKGKKEVTE